jgi:hypothetical protein
MNQKQQKKQSPMRPCQGKELDTKCPMRPSGEAVSDEAVSREKNSSATWCTPSRRQKNLTRKSRKNVDTKGQRSEVNTKSPHVFFLEQDLQYPRGYPETFPLPDGFLPDNEFFQAKKVRVDYELYTSSWAKPSTRTISGPADLPVKDNQLILKKFLSSACFSYEHEYDEDDWRWHKIRGKNFDEIKKIRLKIEEVICERVKEKRGKRKKPDEAVG